MKFAFVVLFALAGMAQADLRHAEKKGSQEQGGDGWSASGSMQASGLVPAFPNDVTCPAIASPFGSATRYDGSLRPTTRFGGRHGGIDLSLVEGTPLRAVAAGRVIAMGTGGQAEGIYLWLQHPPEDTGFPFWVYTKYQHLREVPNHTIGAPVQTGEVVGLSGSTGTAGGHYGARGYAHLHLTAVAARSGEYERVESRVVAEASRLFDPVALYVRDLKNPDEIGRLPEDRKRVPIPYVAEDGSIHPAGSRLVWPVGCKRR